MNLLRVALKAMTSSSSPGSGGDPKATTLTRCIPQIGHSPGLSQVLLPSHFIEHRYFMEALSRHLQIQ